MSDKILEELEEKWHMLPWWVKVRIVIIITWSTWESQLADWWLCVVIGRPGGLE